MAHKPIRAGAAQVEHVVVADFHAATVGGRVDVVGQPVRGEPHLHMPRVQLPQGNGFSRLVALNFGVAVTTQ